MGEFRIMPRQVFRNENHGRYGFFIENHPRGDPKTGRYLASWDTFEMAYAAAHCLGVSPYKIEGIGYHVPKTAEPIAL